MLPPDALRQTPESQLGAQLGGPQGVRAKERLLSTLQIEGGMKMHAVPRATEGQ